MNSSVKGSSAAFGCLHSLMKTAVSCWDVWTISSVLASASLDQVRWVIYSDLYRTYTDYSFTSTHIDIPFTNTHRWHPSNKSLKASSVDVRLQHVLRNPWFAAPIQLGAELAKVRFTQTELAESVLTGRRVNSQPRQPLNHAKLCLIGSLVQQRRGIGEAECSGIRSGIRNALASRCE